MNVVEMQNAIRGIMYSGVQHGLEVYTCHKMEGNIVLKNLLINDALRDNINKILQEVVQHKFLKDGVQLDSAENIADNRNVLYEVEQSESYKPFEFLNQKTENGDEQYYREEDQATLFGLCFCVNLNSNKIWLYQHSYAMQKVKRTRTLVALCTGNHIYSPLPGDILRIEQKVDILIIGDSIITDKIGLLEQHFKFETYIRNEASKTLDIINDLKIVADIEKFRNYATKKKLTNAKKLVKAKKSQVLKMTKEQLINNVQAHSRYKEIFTIQDGVFLITSQKKVDEFVKMLNDWILRSDLTGQEYGVEYKEPLAPME